MLESTNIVVTLKNISGCKSDNLVNSENLVLFAYKYLLDAHNCTKD